jgi:two-component system, NtrC family, sensor histidine kinase KinB
MNTIQDSTQKPVNLLLEISRELTAALDLHTVLERVLMLSAGSIGVERASLIVLDDRKKPIDAAIMVEGRIIAHRSDQLQATIESGLAGWALKEGKAVWIPDTSKDSRWLRRQDDAPDQSGSKSAVCLPLKQRDSLVGVLTIVHPQPNYFTQENYSLLQGVADLCGSAIGNARLFESLQSANRRYRELFDDSIDPIFITDMEGEILEANRQASGVTGYQPVELIGRSLFDLQTRDRSVIQEEQSHLSTGMAISFESQMVLRNGGHIPVMVHIRRENIEDVDMMQWLFRDLSERKELDRLRDDLSAMIYHDLRSPLANVISSLDIMLVSQQDINSPNAGLIQIAYRSAERMQRLISALLDISRLEAGQSILKPKITEARTLLQEAIDVVKPNIDSKQQVTAVVLPNEPIFLYVDVDMIRRVIINLTENANKFTPNGGAIQLGCLQQEDKVELWVRDSGPGIPPESAITIFEKYVRLQAENAPKGLGLGLAFCRLAVEAHGGKIWVESARGHGSRFVMTLPLAKETL